MLHNYRSLVNKLIKFQNFVYTSSYNIIEITEMWLNSTIADSEILPAGFTTYRSDRNARGEGVLLAINSVSSQLVDYPDNLELILFLVGLNNPIRICLLYNPPNTSTNYRQNLISYLENLNC